MSSSAGGAPSQPRKAPRRWTYDVLKGLVVAGVGVAGWLTHVGSDDWRYDNLQAKYKNLSTDNDGLVAANRQLNIENDGLKIRAKKAEDSLAEERGVFNSNYSVCMKNNSEFVTIFSGNSEADKQLDSLRTQKDNLDTSITSGHRYGQWISGGALTPDEIADMRIQSAQLQEQILKEEGQLQCEPHHS